MTGTGLFETGTGFIGNIRSKPHRYIELILATSFCKMTRLLHNKDSIVTTKVHYCLTNLKNNSVEVSRPLPFVTPSFTIPSLVTSMTSPLLHPLILLSSPIGYKRVSIPTLCPCSHLSVHCTTNTNSTHISCTYRTISLCLTHTKASLCCRWSLPLKRSRGGL